MDPEAKCQNVGRFRFRPSNRPDFRCPYLSSGVHVPSLYSAVNRPDRPISHPFGCHTSRVLDDILRGNQLKSGAMPTRLSRQNKCAWLTCTVVVSADVCIGGLSPSELETVLQVDAWDGRYQVNTCLSADLRTGAANLQIQARENCQRVDACHLPGPCAHLRYLHHLFPDHGIQLILARRPRRPFYSPEIQGRFRRDDYFL